MIPIKKYEAPQLFVDTYAADTLIASGGVVGNPKNGNTAKNQNCYGCKSTLGAIDNDNVCIFYPGDGGAYDLFC